MLIISIIGHRDLRSEDIEAIEASLRDWWSSQLRRFGKITPIIMSSLAPGADQLGAWTFTRSGLAPAAQLQPVLPYDQETYSEDIRREEAEYNPGGVIWSFGILASGPHVLRPVHTGCTDELPGRDRRDCYRGAGRYLAEKSHVLVALWDGIYGGAKGSTSDTIGYAQSQECQEVRARGGLPPLEIHWLAVPRRSNPFPAAEAFAWQSLQAQPPAVGSSHGRIVRFVRRPLVYLPALMASISVLASVTGYWLNLRGTLELHPWLWFDRVLVAISHLTLNSFDADPAGPGATWIRAGRAFAVGFVVTTVASVMNHLFRWLEGAALFVARLRDHDLVCGLGWRGRAFVASSGRDAVPTIAVDQSPSEVTRRMCASIGVPLVVGDATRSETIDRLTIARVQSAFVACNEDETNMRVVHQLAKARGRGDRRMVCCVGLDSQSSFRVLQQALPKNHQLDLRIFNPEAVTARILLRTHPIDRLAASRGASGVEVILLGSSRMAEELLQQVLQHGILEEGKRLRLVWVTRDPDDSCSTLAGRYPIYQASIQGSPTGQRTALPPKVWLREGVLPEIIFHSKPTADSALIDLFEGQLLATPDAWVTTVFVALHDPAASASVASALAPSLEAERLGRGHDITLVCYYNTPEQAYRSDIEQALNHDFPALPVRVFSDFMGDLSKAVARGDELDLVARRINGLHSDKHKALGDRGDAFCHDAWIKATEDEKDSSRQAAAHAFVKKRIRARMRAAGYSSDAISHALACIEHRRWCAENLLKGYRPLTRIPSEVVSPFVLSAEEKERIERWFGGEKMALKGARRHVDLVPFSDLRAVLSWDVALGEMAKDADQMEHLDWLLS